jgi:farnesyl diphosphate synthase
VPDNFEARIDTYTARVDSALDRALPAKSTSPERLHSAMRYAVLTGGKRVRPLLVYATGECLQIEPQLLDAPAVAIELIHAFSLVHDDLPAMDNDDLRRGKPTVHKQYDEATAILAADALQPLAFSVLADLQNAPPDAAIQLVQLLAKACGSIGMTGGQSIDLAAEGMALSESELECENLASDDFNALDDFARNVGLAFQIKDDILDVEGDTAVIGKPAGSDESQNKATYPALFGINASRKRCDDLLNNALSNLSRFGSSAAPLEWLARFIVERGR